MGQNCMHKMKHLIKQRMRFSEVGLCTLTYLLLEKENIKKTHKYEKISSLHSYEN